MMNPKYLISGAAAALVVAGGLAFAQTTEPTAQPQDPSLQQPASPSSTEPGMQQQQQPATGSDSSSTGSSPSSTSTPPSDAPSERPAQADRN